MRLFPAPPNTGKYILNIFICILLQIPDHFHSLNHLSKIVFKIHKRELSRHLSELVQGFINFPGNVVDPMILDAPKPML